MITKNNPKYSAIKQEIIEKYGVVKLVDFNPEEAIKSRINYLKEFLKKTNRKGYVLGISGGVDSSLTGKLCQIACSELRSEGYPAYFIAMRLPAGIQKDEVDAQVALDFINPDHRMTVNIGEAANLISEQGVSEFSGKLTDGQIDFNKGNIKARLRMVAQYQAAAMYEGLVIGTDHNAEAVMGFYTLFGDGACDLTVLNGVNKRQIRLMAKTLGAPDSVWNKAPTADLEELNPGKLDDEGFGFKYEFLDLFLEGEEIPEYVELMIINQYARTYFKREPIPGFH
jgi:NAD+ synthase